MLREARAREQGEMRVVAALGLWSRGEEEVLPDLVNGLSGVLIGDRCRRALHAAWLQDEPKEKEDWEAWLDWRESTLR